MAQLFSSYEQILLDQDPLPSYGLKLLLALLESNTGFIKQVENLGLVSVIFQVLLVSLYACRTILYNVVIFARENQQFGFRQGLTQTGLYSHRIRLEA